MGKCVALLMVLLLMGCSRNSSADRSSTLHIGNAVEPPTLDPHLMVDIQAINVSRGLFEGLVLLNPQTLEVIPGTAERWEVSNDGLQYDFYLRKDARWTNGQHVRAQDFADGIRRALNVEMGSPTVNLIFPVKNARAYYERKANFDEIGIQVIDNQQLRIRLERPTPYFIYLLTHPVWSPILRENLNQFNAFDRRDSPWARPGNLITNGPFYLDSWRPGDRIEIRRNAFYWNNKDTSISAVIFFPLTDQNTEQNAFQTGEIDITTTVPADRLAFYRQQNPSPLHENASLGCFYYILNCQQGPLQNVRVRRALAASVDRQSLCKILQRNENFAANHLVPNGTGGYEFSSKGITFDPRQAQQWLSEAGYPEGDGFPVLTLVFNSSDQHRLIAQAIQEMWKQYLGIRVQLRSEDWKTFLITRRSGNYDIGRGGWIGDFNDPLTFLELFESNAIHNFPRWRNARYDAELQAANDAQNSHLRLLHLGKAEEILLQEVPIIPLYFETNKYLVSPRVKGWQDNILNYQLYQRLKLQ